MNELFLSPLGPALLLFLASIALRIFASPRRSSVLALLTLLPLALTTVLLIRLRSLPGALVASTTWWPVVVPAQEILWAMDGWNWLSLLLILLTGTTAILLTWFVPGKRSGAFHGLSMLLLATAAVTVVSDNLLALSGAWVATDIALIAVARSRQAPALDGEPRRRTAPIWYVAGGSLLVMMAIGITSLSIASTNLASASFPPETVILLLVAAALRMAAYPLHVWLAPDSVARDRGTQLLVNGIGLITGAWLLGRLVVLGAATWLADPVWIPLLTILVLVASIAAWLSRRADRFSMLASARATWLWLAVALAPIVLGRDASGMGADQHRADPDAPGSRPGDSGAMGLAAAAGAGRRYPGRSPVHRWHASLCVGKPDQSGGVPDRGGGNCAGSGRCADERTPDT